MSNIEDNTLIGNTQRSHNQATDVTGSEIGQKRKRDCKEMAPRSTVWSHFTKFPEDRDKCKCNYCGAVLKCASSQVGTSSLKSHNQRCKQYKLYLDNKNQAVLGHEEGDSEKGGNLVIRTFSQEACRRATTKMIILDELPFAFVENLGFRHFCSIACPTYILPSRQTVARDIQDMFMEEKMLLKKVLTEKGQRISFTTDIWTSITADSYMVVTAHFIDANWRLHRTIISFNTIPDHKADTISKQLQTCLLDWGIKRVFTLTVDNASGNDVVVKYFRDAIKSWGDETLVLDGEYMHVRCGAHILNLIVNEGLKDLDKSISSIRNTVKYVRSSSSRLYAFKMRAMQDKIGRGSVILDCGTRWNSTYLMLNAALKFKPAFERMANEDKLYDAYFHEKENGKKRDGPPDTNDWECARRLVKFLKMFYDSTLVFSSSTKVTSSTCYEEICTIEKSLSVLCNSEDSLLSLMAKDMMEKFDKYWEGTKKINRLLIVATVLDPRNKMSFATYCFEKLYGKDSQKCGEVKEGVMSLLHQLFGVYGEKYTNLTNVGASINASASGSGSGSGNVDVNFSLDDNDEREEGIRSEYSRMMFGNRDMIEASSELEIYLMEKVEIPTNNRLGLKFDLLSWWRVNSGKYPILSLMARDILAIPVSTVASESAFSTGGRILDQYRSCLTPGMVEALILTQNWLRNAFRYNDKVNLQDIIDDFEFMDALNEVHRNASFTNHDG